MNCDYKKWSRLRKQWNCTSRSVCCVHAASMDVYAVYKIILSNAKIICIRMRGRSAAGHAPGPRPRGLASSSSMINYDPAGRARRSTGACVLRIRVRADYRCAARRQQPFNLKSLRFFGKVLFSTSSFWILSVRISVVLLHHEGRSCWSGPLRRDDGLLCVSGRQFQVLQDV